MTVLVVTWTAACTSTMISFGRVGEEIPEDQTTEYLKRSIYDCAFFLTAFVTETVASLIAGYLMVKYSRNEKSNLREDPVTGMEVPSLIFVFNQQQIINCVAGVRTETPEQYKERMKVYNKEYVETYIKGILKSNSVSCSIYDSLFTIQRSDEYFIDESINEGKPGENILSIVTGT